VAAISSPSSGREGHQPSITRRRKEGGKIPMRETLLFPKPLAYSLREIPKEERKALFARKEKERKARQGCALFFFTYLTARSSRQTAERRKKKKKKGSALRRRGRKKDDSCRPAVVPLLTLNVFISSPPWMIGHKERKKKEDSPEESRATGLTYFLPPSGSHH